MTVHFAKDRRVWRYDFQLGGVRHAGNCVHPRTKAKAVDAGTAREIEALIRSKLPRPAAGRRNLRSAKGWIYFLATADGQFIKIGWTQKIRGRLTDLQVANPQELKLALKIRGTMEEEKALHKALAGHRVRGEWFTYDSLIEDVMTWKAGSVSFDQAMEGLRQKGIVSNANSQIEVAPEKKWCETPPEIERGKSLVSL